MKPQVDVIVLMRDARPLHPDVERGLRRQHEVELAVHRVIGKRLPGDRCRWDAIARARNEGKLRGSSPWLMFLDDDVVLAPACIAQLVAELRRRPAYGALGADYLGQLRPGRVANHVSMGATIFRREALEQIYFAWREKRCECQCCCDDLRRLYWGIDYFFPAKARHLPKGEVGGSSSVTAPARCGSHKDASNRKIGTSSQGLPSVCLVACYLGPPPGWIRQYLLSCSYNPSINFLILTDQRGFPAAPPNVRIEQITEESFNQLATKTIGAEIKLSHPRKLCDFKPAYGHLFEEYLQNYDYWGYTDLDVIYGDIRRFLSVAKFHRYDVFTARKEFLVGHFSLFRNNSRMRTLYQQGANYRATLQSPIMLSFSECGKQWRQRLRGEPLTDDAACDSMMHIICRETAKNRISACYSRAVIEWPDLTKRPWRLRWHAGRLWSIDQRREAMYFHFNAFRRRPGYRQPAGINGDTAFEMTPHGFERASASLSPA
jgi:hypothetical protein